MPNFLTIPELLCPTCRTETMVWKNGRRTVTCTACGHPRRVKSTPRIDGQTTVTIVTRKSSVYAKSAQFHGREYPAVLARLRALGYSDLAVWDAGKKALLLPLDFAGKI